MKKIISVLLAIIIATTVALPVFANCITVTVDTTSEPSSCISTSCVGRAFNSIIALIQKMFSWLFRFNITNPNIENPDPVQPDPVQPDPINPDPEQPEPVPMPQKEDGSILTNDPNKDVPNGFPVKGSDDHTATTRGVAYELIYDYFSVQPNFNPGTKYTVNETNSPKINKAVNFILANESEDALVYIGINEVSEAGTKVNVCPDVPATTAFLNAMLFSIPTVSQLIVLNEDPNAPLSREQVDYIVHYAVLYTQFKDGEFTGAKGSLTRQEAYEIFQKVYSDSKKTLIIPEPEKQANVEFLDYLAIKFSGSVASHSFGSEPHMPVTPGEVQFIAELNKLQMYEQLVCYQAEIL